ncbi:hypothetical protein [Psychrobacter sp. I-STPA6b]|uniref:hypothetical protein n=1 Tax=Psychrobacter sp. I-STPA6b TaxID=2585718 RepID=UPI001D0C6BAF|nr:hypothetical protein [Psychrobacter sp. I-STPA6b]
MRKYSKTEVSMHAKDGIKLKGELSPWIRFCIGMGILFLTASPFILAIKWW